MSEVEPLAEWEIELLASSDNPETQMLALMRRVEILTGQIVQLRETQEQILILVSQAHEQIKPTLEKFNSGPLSMLFGKG